MEPRLREPVAIVFYPENSAIPQPVQDWRNRNPDWRRPLDEVIVCPVCGITVRAVVDHALLDAEGIQEEITHFRDEYLRAACSDHFWPTEEHWALMESKAR